MVSHEMAVYDLLSAVQSWWLSGPECQRQVICYSGSNGHEFGPLKLRLQSLSKTGLSKILSHFFIRH